MIDAQRACRLAMNPKKLGKVDKDKGHLRSKLAAIFPEFFQRYSQTRDAPPRAESPGAFQVRFWIRRVYHPK